MSSTNTKSSRSLILAGALCLVATPAVSGFVSTRIPLRNGLARNDLKANFVAHRSPMAASVLSAPRRTALSTLRMQQQDPSAVPKLDFEEAIAETAVWLAPRTLILCVAFLLPQPLSRRLHAMLSSCSVVARSGPG
eukprot:1308679-Rhodomonas_salina.1